MDFGDPANASTRFDAAALALPFPGSRQGWSALLRDVRRALRSSHDAEDLLHSAFVRFAEYPEREAVINPAAFLVRTAANLAVDERRRRSRREISSPAEELIEIADERPMHADQLATQQRLEGVLAGLATLGARTSEILLMNRVGGLRHRDIAKHLGITVSAVEKHIAKANVFLLRWGDQE